MSDYISREAVLEFIRGYRHSTDVAFHMEKHLNEIPAADVRPVVRGKWETVMLDHDRMGLRPITHYCSECHQITWFRTFYCPYCGADMRESKQESKQVGILEGGKLMYDELVKRLRNSATEANPWLMFTAAYAIEELSKKRDAACWGCKCSKIERNEWIPVTERLPCLTTPVLVTDGIEVDIAWMYGVPPRWITSFTAIDEDKLTHWMPLPQTPKDGES